MSTSRLASIVVVLLEPQDPVNIAGTVRAMKNMGAHTLRLVRPVPYDTQRLAGVAHDADEIIQGIRHFDDLQHALADCVRVAGFTARRRAAKRGVIEPRQAAGNLLAQTDSGPVALLFGREDRGLPNDALDQAHIVVTIPTTEHASLNLAQAVLLALYELHIAAGDATRKLAPPRKAADPPTASQFQLLFDDAARALQEVAFFKTRNEEHVMRSLRSLAYRADPDAREIALLRAVAIEVVRSIARIRGERHDHRD